MKDFSALIGSQITMDPWTVQLCVLVLCVLRCDTAPVSDSLVVNVGAPDSTRLGHTATLPCWLSPAQTAEDLEVRWYRGNHFDTPVMLYQERKFVVASQELSYVGRVSFGLKDAASSGLRTGDVSLKLDNVTLEDAGSFTCYVSSQRGYDSGVVSLVVTETGHTPLLTAMWTEDSKINLSCESGGWYPQPVLHWSDHKQILTPQSLVYRNTSSGLFSAHSWLLADSPSDVSCSVDLSDGEAKEARLRLSKKESSTGNSVGGWVAFAILLILVVVLGIVYFKRKGYFDKIGGKSEHGSDQTDGDEQEQLLNKALSNNHYVNIKLVDTNNPLLKVKDDIVRDSATGDFPHGQKGTCIRGEPGFTDGKHYWEVSLWIQNVHPKKHWWIGVVGQTDIPHVLNVPPNTSNGFWFLSSTPNALRFSTDPQISLPVSLRPRTVGVFLDYDSGELSFYNVEEGTLIGSLTTTFKGEVFPLFNPGNGDMAPMKILHRDLNQASEQMVSNSSAKEGTVTTTGHED